MPPLQSFAAGYPHIPIVFAGVVDPVGAGIVESLSQPNATGLTLFEYGTGAKWLELLKQVAPRVTRVAVTRDPSVGGVGEFAAIQSSAQSFHVDLRPGLRDANEIEQLSAHLHAAPTMV